MFLTKKLDSPQTTNIRKAACKTVGLVDTNNNRDIQAGISNCRQALWFAAIQSESGEEMSVLHDDGLRTSDATQEIQRWQEEILTITTRVVFALLLPFWILRIINAFVSHTYWWLGYDLTYMVLIAATTFVPKLGFALRTSLLLGIAYISGILWLIISGLHGTGRIYFIIVVVLAALLLNHRATLLIWLVSLLTIGSIYLAFLLRLIPLPTTDLKDIYTPLSLEISWIAQAVVSGISGGAILLTMQKLYQGLHLEHKVRAEFQRVNYELEQYVDERTLEVQEATEKLQHELSQRKQAEQELRENQALLQGIIDYTPTTLYIKDTQGRYRQISKQAARDLGYSRDQIIGKTDDDLFPSHIHDTWRTTDEQILTAGKSLQFEIELPLHDGDHSYIALKFPIFNEQGTICAIGGTATDITEHKRMEQALLETNVHLLEAYRTLVEHSIQGLAIIQDGCFVYVNSMMCQILGYTQNELLAMSAENILDMIHPDDREIMQLYYQQWNDKHDIPPRCEYGTFHKDGNVRWLENHISQTTYQNKPAIQIACIDITQRKQAELALQGALLRLEQRVAERTAELRESQALLQGVLDHSPAIIFVQDPHERYLMVNQYALSQYALRREELIGKTNYDIMPIEIASVWSTTHQQVLMTGQNLIFEEQVAVNGKTQTFLTTKFPIFNSEGSIFAVGGIATDITERKQAEEALQRAKEAAESATRTKSEFLATMSHEIRTPMNAVIGMTNLLLDTPLTPEQHDYTETIRISGDALLTIINDILDFSKIEAGRLDLEHSPFNLRTCIEESLELLAPKAAEKGIELAYWIDTNVPALLMGDMSRVRQILVNLISNAVKFTDQGEIIVSVRGWEMFDEDHAIQSPSPTKHLPPYPTQRLTTTSHHPYRIHISVRDTGIGIPAERFDRLFQSFSQIDGSTTRMYGGTGLGLAISKRLSEMMDGTIWAESEVGIGSTFHVLIGTEPIATEPLPFLSSDQPDLQGKRMLIISENTSMSQILHRYTTVWGVQTFSVESIDAACAWLSQQTEACHVIVLNVHQPTEHVASVIERIHTSCTRCNSPIVALVSLTMRRCLHSTATFDNASCLVKPIRPALLHTTLIKLIRGEPVESSDTFERHHPDVLNERTKPLTILLAEDNVINQKVALRLLDKIGYRADVAATGYEVLEAMNHRRYDVILMDIQMPIMDGLETTQRIRTLYPASHQPRIIAMTAHAMNEDRQMCLDAGMDDYIIKPVRLEELATKLSSTPCAITPHQISDASPASPASPASVHQDIHPALDPAAHQHFLTTMGGPTTDLAQELIALFLSDTPDKLAMLRHAVGENDATSLFRIAHALKSSSAQLGAMGLSSLCRDLEMLGRTGNITGAKELIARIGDEFERIQDALQATCSACARPALWSR